MVKKRCKSCSKCIRIVISYKVGWDSHPYEKIPSKHFCSVYKHRITHNEECWGEDYVKGSNIEIKLDLIRMQENVELKRYCPVCEKWFRGGKYRKVCSDECEKEWDIILKAKRLLHDLRSG